MAAVLAILVAVVGGQAIGLVLGGLTLPAWLTLADLALKLSVDEVQLLKAVHPALGRLHDDLRQGHPVSTAIHNARSFFPGTRPYKPEDFSPYNHLGMGM